MMELVKAISDWAIPVLLCFIPLYGYLKGVKVYESFVAGAEEGFWVAVKILPYLVAILVAMGIFRSSGALEAVTFVLGPLVRFLGVPAEVLPLMLMRPLSGSGALGITLELFDKWGPDSFIGRLASVIHSSTETTFYVITLYFGSVGVRNPRYAVAVGLIGDIAGFAAATFITRLVFG